MFTFRHSLFAFRLNPAVPTCAITQAANTEKVISEKPRANGE
jgi:hypothetical protein